VAGEVESTVKYRGSAALQRSAVIYETHIEGITAAHPEVPPELRGTYAGLGHPAVLEHLSAWG
jgi:pullulanase/glycogen debranching enzyme